MLLLVCVSAMATVQNLRGLRSLAQDGNVFLGFPQMQFIGHDLKPCGWSVQTECKLPVLARVVMFKEGNPQNDLKGSFQRQGPLWRYKAPTNPAKSKYDEEEIWDLESNLWPEWAEVYVSASSLDDDLELPDPNGLMNGTFITANGEWYEVPFPETTRIVAMARWEDSNGDPHVSPNVLAILHIKEQVLTDLIEFDDDTKPPRGGEQSFMRLGIHFRGITLDNSRFNASGFIGAVYKSINEDRRRCEPGQKG